MIAKQIALLAVLAASDQTAKAGYFVDASGVIVTSASVVPFGVITEGGLSGENSTLAVCAAFSGIVHVKVASSTGTIAKGTRLQLNADGTVKADVGTGRVVAIAMEAGVADELIEAVLVPAQVSNPFVLVSTAGATLTAEQSGGIVSNKGATGAVSFPLPAALPGMNFTAIVEAAYALRLDPNGTETIALPSSGVQGAAGKYLEADAVGEKVKLVCLTAGTWSVEHYSGTWTAEA
jgi:hypothetical protein